MDEFGEGDEDLKMRGGHLDHRAKESMEILLTENLSKFQALHLGSYHSSFVFSRPFCLEMRNFYSPQLYGSSNCCVGWRCSQSTWIIADCHPL